MARDPRHDHDERGGRGVNEYRGGHDDREHRRGLGGGAGSYRGLAYRASYDPGEHERRLYRHEEDVARHRDRERHPRGYRERGPAYDRDHDDRDPGWRLHPEARGYRERGAGYDHDRDDRDRSWRFEREARGYRERGPAFDSARGPHAGKGPKGYRRSDERIREDVCERVMGADWVDARDVEVEVADGEVTLSGTIATREAKRAIEDLADAVRGVHDVHNRLRVTRLP